MMQDDQTWIAYGLSCGKNVTAVPCFYKDLTNSYFRLTIYSPSGFAISKCFMRRGD